MSLGNCRSIIFRVSMPSLASRLSDGPTTATRTSLRQDSRRQSSRSAPYTKPNSRDNSFFSSSDDNSNGTWKHDKFASHNGIQGGTLAARLSATRVGGISTAPKMDLTPALKAVEEAHRPGRPGSIKPIKVGTATRELSIKGVARTTVEVSGLVGGTTAADVEAIFKRCGEVAKAELVSTPSDLTAIVRVQFQSKEAAEAAVQKFNGQPADGQTLKVTIVPGPGDSIKQRLGVDGVVAKGVKSIDALLESNDGSHGKMRSDDILNSDPRAQLVVDSSGVNINQVIPPAVKNASLVAVRGRGKIGRGANGAHRGKALSERIGVVAMELD